MVNIALYGSNDRLLDELEGKLLENFRFTGTDYYRFQRLSFYQTSLFEGVYDLFIIDITEHAERGLAFIKDLKMSQGVEVIFIAAKPAFAMDAYDLDGLAYLLTPPDYSRLARIILKRFPPKKNATDGQSVTFNTSEGVRVVNMDRIVYIKYTNHRMNIVLDDGITVTTSSMRISFSAAAKDVLANPDFVRSHASYIVNISHIVEFGSAFITLDSKSLIPVSHAKHSAVKKRILEYFSSPD